MSVSNIYLPAPSTLSEVRDETPDIRTFLIEPRQPFDYRPGQFAMLSLWGHGEAPFSIASSRSDGDVMEFSIKRIGGFTEQMHQLQPGEEVGIRGPFGNWFDVDAARGANLVFVGGGIGLAPLRSLIHEVLHRRSDFGQVVILYGARTPADLVYRDELNRLAARSDLRVELTVDVGEAGWVGHVGVVPELVKKASEELEEWMAFLCGPGIMIRFTAQALLERGVEPGRIVTTLERHMQCGLGKCGHCYLGGKLVCTDGPVFTLKELQEMGTEP